MTTKTTKWDSAEHLETPEDLAAYIDAAFEEGEPALIAHAIGVAARAKGMTEIATDAGLTRASLYKALSEGGNPEFATVMKVMKALGIRISAAAA